MIRRQLEQIVANPGELREINFMDLIRRAFEAGLIVSVPAYKIFREKRNMTTYTYDTDKAEAVLEGMHDFLTEIHFLLKELRNRND